MIRKTLIAIVGAAAMVAIVQTAQAAFTTSDTLADLLNPTGTYNGLAVGDKQVTGFTAVENGLVGYNPAAIIVTLTEPVANQYILTWGGSIGTVSAGLNLADLLLNYTVTATSGKIFAIDQNYTGTAPIPGGSLSVSETVTAPGSAVILASSQLNYAITSTSYTATGAILTPGQAIVNVAKDISFSTLIGGTIDISQIEQSFEETAVPEPTTIIAGALLLLPFGASTLRILRKNRTA